MKSRGLRPCIIGVWALPAAESGLLIVTILILVAYGRERRLRSSCDSHYTRGIAGDFVAESTRG